jgi:hypothetical protein
LPLSLLLFFPAIESLYDEVEAKEIESNGSKIVAEGDYKVIVMIVDDVDRYSS